MCSELNAKTWQLMDTCNKHFVCCANLINITNKYLGHGSRDFTVIKSVYWLLVGWYVVDIINSIACVV